MMTAVVTLHSKKSLLSVFQRNNTTPKRLGDGKEEVDTHQVARRNICRTIALVEYDDVDLCGDKKTALVKRRRANDNALAAEDKALTVLFLSYLISFTALTYLSDIILMPLAIFAHFWSEPQTRPN